VVVVAVRDEGEVLASARALGDALAAEGLRVEVDDRTGVSLGRRVTDWELKGVPVRLELGPRDLADGAVTLARRISGDKQSVALAGVATAVAEELEREQAALLADATAFRDARIVDAGSLDAARDAAATGWARVPWDAVGAEGEAELAQSGVTVRCLTRADGSLPAHADESDLVAYVARAY
jgi:prolyl-tRNA synthetase